MIFFLLACYNEEKAIEPVFRDILSVFGMSGYRIVLVDDGSGDGTAGTADKMSQELKIPLKILRHPCNMGLGAALKTGLGWICKNASGGDFVVTMDCDNTHPPATAWKMAAKLPGCDAVIASRFRAGGRQKGVPFLRAAVSRIASRFFRLFYPAVSDWSSGFRAYRVEVIRESKIPERIREKGFISQLEILLMLLRGKAGICEVPLRMDYSLKKSRSKMRFFPLVFSYAKFLFCYLTKHKGQV
ncbi:MAG: glycosyltransferase family 2 protein [bacterium]